MPRIRLQFIKGEPARFISHLELSKTFERAVRRAELPIAFSEGFNPHPKISFASALAVGVTSDVELVDLELTEDLSPAQVAKVLASQMPPGLEIRQAAVVKPNAPALMAVVDRAIYQVLVEAPASLEQEELTANIEKFLDLPNIEVEKFSKKGNKIVNIRPGIFEFSGEVLGGTVRFSLELMTGSQGNVRPEDVVRALVSRSLAPIDLETMVAHRTGMAVAEAKGNRSSFEVGLLD